MIDATPFSISLGSSRRVWLSHLTVLTCLLLALGGLNWLLIVSAVSVWLISPTFSHCFLIIPVSAFLIWQRRQELALITPRAMPAALFWAIPVVLFQLSGAVSSITEAQQIAFIGLVQLIVLAILGRDAYARILFPMVFLFFLVPMGEYLVVPLQSFTAKFISVGLTLLGILHHTEGTIIELVNGSFRVAEACAGLRFLIATIATGALFCYLNYNRWYKVAIYMLASAVVPVIANGFRALGIVLLAHYSNNTIAVGADHLIYGWGFSVVILGLLMVVGVRFADPIPDIEPIAKSIRSESPNAFGKAVILSVVAVIAVPSFLYWNDHRPAIINAGALNAISVGDDWQQVAPSGNWAPDFFNADAVRRFGLKKPGEAQLVDVAIHFYSRSRNGHGLITSSNVFWEDEDWHKLSQHNINTRLGSVIVPMTELVISSPTHTEIIRWTYWADNRFTPSALKVKLGSLQTLIGGPSGTAMFAVSTAVDGDPDIATARLTSAMASLGDIPKLLRVTAGIQ